MNRLTPYVKVIWISFLSIAISGLTVIFMSSTLQLAHRAQASPGTPSSDDLSDEVGRLREDVECLRADVDRLSLRAESAPDRRAMAEAGESTKDDRTSGILGASSDIKAYVDARIQEALDHRNEMRVQGPLEAWLSDLESEYRVPVPLDENLQTLLLKEFWAELAYMSLPRGDDRRDPTHDEWKEAQRARIEYVETVYGLEFADAFATEWYRFLPALKMSSTGLTRADPTK